MNKRPTVLGNIGDKIEDGPLGTALRELAEICQEYIQSDEDGLYASVLCVKSMEVGHLVIDLLEELGLVTPEVTV
jgi:hypothetical protein